MRKLTFERAVLIVFILIILISTSDTTLKYIEIYLKGSNTPMTDSAAGQKGEFPEMLMNAEKLYKLGKYEEAAEEYLTMALNNTSTIEQKTHAYFRLGICQYNLKNYERAVDSFESVVSFSPNDSLAYNNAAVNAYKANNIAKAIELQQKALDILAAVEYYYNLGRMLEDNEKYEEAAQNYALVAKGEHNITSIERIDPVRVKEKIARLQPAKSSSVSDITNALFVLKLNDDRELLTVEENEMQLKPGEFIVDVENNKNVKNIIAHFDKEKYDPYKLISELTWTIFKEGKQLYKKNGDKITASVKDGGNYEVKLNIRYNGNKQISSTKSVRIKENESIVDVAIKDEVIVKPGISEEMKTYPFATYEQLFEGDFKISSSGYTDKYGVVWGKDSGVETVFNKKLAVDKLTSLVISNNASQDAGLWINLDSLLNQSDIKGKSVNISFYARQISGDADLDISVRVKAGEALAITQESVILGFKFEQKSTRIFIPENASGVTVSIKTKSGEEFNIDRFIIVD